jgi:folate-binding protein YgfZ
MTQPALQSDFTPLTSAPEHYGDVRAEYEAIRHGAALVDLSPAGKLQLAGKNAIQFLNGLVSNDVKSLAPGAGVFACFPNLQGKVAALSVIYHTGNGLLFELDASNREKIFKNLSRFVPAGEFFLTDVTNDFALFSLQGPQSAHVLTQATDTPLEYTEARNIRSLTVAGVPCQVANHNRAGGAGFDVYVPTAQASAVWATLLSFGAKAVGQAALNIARLEAGIPREPDDINESYIINETNLTEAVSYTKGCYLGQEVIARIHWRGQPAKQLRGLLLDTTATDLAGAELWANDAQGIAKKVGEITSAAQSFALERPIGFGYVHRYFLNAGQEFTLKQGEAEIGKATLAETPFVS